ncbi:MAG: hypothetical protein MUP98_17330 [Candidatus Aminicenantes bacterium]|nr:hypothetical protein [Candidatus Aminicenantes bacterium]
MKTHDLFYVPLSFLVFVLLLAALYFPHQNRPPIDRQIMFQVASETGSKSARFNSVESEFDFRLTYDWEDFNENDFSVSFSLSKNALKEAEDEFGFYPDEFEKYVAGKLTPLRNEMIVHLKKITQKLIKKSKYSEHFFIDEDNPDSFNLRLTSPPLMQSQLRSEFKRITSEIARQQTKYYKKIESASLVHKRDFLQNSGLRYIGDKIGVNYGLLVKINQERVRQVFQNLLEESRGLNFQQFLSFLLSYIQEIRYSIPPVMENGKYIMGFWVPPKVLINNFGDCDSKGVTFASLWINFKKYPILLIQIPKHLFIGLAVPSFSEEGVTINGLRYTLCEVTGPDKIPPGMIAPYSQLHLDGGNYTYELIK